MPYELPGRREGPARAGRLRLGGVLPRADDPAARRAAARGGRPVRLSPELFHAAPERRQPDLAERGTGGVSARDSIGLSFDGEGKIVEIVPGMVGDRAGLAPGMKVIGVNGKTFSAQRLLDALADSVKRREDRIPPGRGGRLPHDRPRLCRRPALPRAGPRHREARPPRRDPQAGRGTATLIGCPREPIILRTDPSRVDLRGSGLYHVARRLPR